MGVSIFVREYTSLSVLQHIKILEWGKEKNGKYETM
jgi:hypothetical protein